MRLTRAFAFPASLLGVVTGVGMVAGAGLAHPQSGDPAAGRRKALRRVVCHASVGIDNLAAWFSSRRIEVKPLPQSG